nr:PilZ domain-containing protein [uncultured Hyphomonas sp.]
MTFSTSQALMTSETPEEYFDRRRHKRVDLRLPGRFLTHVGNDAALSTVNLSCSGALVQSSTLPDPGAELVCYFDDLGRVVATVVRHTGEGFALSFKVASHKREKIADRLTWLLNKNMLNLSEEREAPRHAADVPALVLRSGGQMLPCRVLDISLTGANFECHDTTLPKLGEIVSAGSIPAEVVRTGEGGFAVRYLQQDERKAL